MTKIGYYRSWDQIVVFEVIDYEEPEEFVDIMYASHTTKRVKVLRLLNFDQTSSPYTMIPDNEGDNVFKVGKEYDAGEDYLIYCLSIEPIIPKPKNGEWKKWYTNGNIAQRQHYKDGKLDGNAFTWYYEGEVASEGSYRDNKLEGTYKEYYRNGDTKCETFYVKGKKDGLWRKWYESGQLKIEGSYGKGTKIGVWRYYDEDGNITRMNWFKKNGYLKKSFDPTSTKQ